jgi:hypothetical protein
MIERPIEVGVDSLKLAEAASRDDAISEFCRFYLERRDEETRAAGGDERKRKKLMDEFTPRLHVTLVGLKGRLHREIRLRVRYAFDSEPGYESLLTVVPNKSELSDAPELAICSQSGRKVPRSCLGKCEISGADVLRHLLAKSEVSGRRALPKFILACALSGKSVLKDEVAQSAVTGRLIAEAFLVISQISGKRAEPEHFGRCYFTDSEILKTELKTSEISGMPYRIDHEMRSAISGKVGHRQEFTNCYVTGQPMAKIEAETCEVTGQQVRPGILETCAVSGKHVLPSELQRCTATGKQALKKYLVTSSLSQARVLEAVAIRSIRGEFCAPSEARQCFWSCRISHPADLRTCALTGLSIHFDFATAEGAPRLQPLAEMLDGIRRTTDESHLWEDVRARIVTVLGSSKCRVALALLDARVKIATAKNLHPERLGKLYPRYCSVMMQIREEKDLSIEELSALSGLSENFLEAAESGTVELTDDNLKALQGVYWELAIGEDNPGDFKRLANKRLAKPYPEIGSAMREIREEKQISIKELSNLSGFPEDILVAAESGNLAMIGDDLEDAQRVYWSLSALEASPADYRHLLAAMDVKANGD